MSGSVTLVDNPTGYLDHTSKTSMWVSAQHIPLCILCSSFPLGGPSENARWTIPGIHQRMLRWMVLFGSLLNQFVSSFDRANGLSIFQFDAVWFIDFSAKDFDRWVQWIRDSCFVFNFWKSKLKIYVGVDAIIVSILSFETCCSISAS